MFITLSRGPRAVRTQKGDGVIGLLEPCAVKVARTVLRGGWHGDMLSLPDPQGNRNGGGEGNDAGAPEKAVA